MNAFIWVYTVPLRHHVFYWRSMVSQETCSQELTSDSQRVKLSQVCFLFSHTRRYFCKELCESDNFWINSSQFNILETVNCENHLLLVHNSSGRLSYPKTQCTLHHLKYVCILWKEENSSHILIVKCVKEKTVIRFKQGHSVRNEWTEIRRH